MQMQEVNPQSLYFQATVLFLNYKVKSRSAVLATKALESHSIPRQGSL